MNSNLRNYRIIFWDAEGEDLDKYIIQSRSNNYLFDIIKYNLLTVFMWLICFMVIKYIKFNEKDMLVAYGFGVFLLIGTLVLFISSLKFYGWKEFLNETNNLASFKTKKEAEEYVTKLKANDNNIHKVNRATKTVV
jgi:hypothetical protein